jgi:tRNA A58 N-methylase Trm61
MTVFEPGPGMGFFTLELARLVGPSGRVIAVDIQPRMLSTLKRRLTTAGLLGRVDTRLARPDSMVLDDLRGAVDFTLAFAMVHEMPSANRFFEETATVSKPGATLLLVEPGGHVTDAEFTAEVEAAAAAGFVETDRPQIGRSHAALLKKK